MEHAEFTRCQAEWIVQNGEAKERMVNVFYVNNEDYSWWLTLFGQVARQVSKDLQERRDQGRLWEQAYLATDPRDEDER